MPQSVVITGGSAGIGRAAAELFARQGYNVGLIARNEDRLKKAADDLRGYGGRVEIYAADVADAEAVEAAAESFEEAFGQTDVWVNNAMTTIIAPFRELSADDFRRITEVNYLGQVHGMKAALKRFRARGRGAIVNVGSGLAFRAVPLQSAYCATKHAVKAATEALRTELRHEGSPITVSMVHPSGINTPQFDWTRTSLSSRPQPVPPVFSPHDVARAIVKAAHEGPREIFVGTPAFAMSALSNIVPGLLDWQLARSAYDDQSSDKSLTEQNKQIGYHEEPAPGDPGAEGSFTDQVEDRARLIDGDKGRFALLASGFAASFIAGALVNRATRRGPFRLLP